MNIKLPEDKSWIAWPIIIGGSAILVAYAVLTAAR
jgi:hypothetical protein